MVPGYPDRLFPVDAKAAAELKKRTLTNAPPRQLDDTVAAAYGWPADLAEPDILARLLELNLDRAGR